MRGMQDDLHFDETNLKAMLFIKTVIQMGLV